MNFRTVGDLNACIIKNLEKIPYDMDLVVGIPRSGILPATLLSLYLNICMTDLTGFLEGRVIKTGRTRQVKKQITNVDESKKILVIDDSVYSGKTMHEVKRMIEDRPEINQEIYYAAVYVTKEVSSKVDIYFEICEKPRRFEWNVIYNKKNSNYCFDLDGVLCRDPLMIENDDGPRYLEFLKNAEPKFLPSNKIGWLVTCRLEKYRPQTESWLKKYGISYHELVMMDLPHKVDRTTLGNHSSFKAEVYRRTGAELFIESSYKQAIEIARKARKPVYCVDKQQFIEPNFIVKRSNQLKGRLVLFLYNSKKRLFKCRLFNKNKVIN